MSVWFYKQSRALTLGVACLILVGICGSVVGKAYAGGGEKDPRVWKIRLSEKLKIPRAVSYDSRGRGSFVVVDSGRAQILRVHLPDGRVDVIAGSGRKSSEPQAYIGGEKATKVSLCNVLSAATASNGDLFFVEHDSADGTRVGVVSSTSKRIWTVTGHEGVLNKQTGERININPVQVFAGSDGEILLLTRDLDDGADFEWKTVIWKLEYEEGLKSWTVDGIAGGGEARVSAGDQLAHSVHLDGRYELFPMRAGTGLISRKRGQVRVLKLRSNSAGNGYSIRRTTAHPAFPDPAHSAVMTATENSDGSLCVAARVEQFYSCMQLFDLDSAGERLVERSELLDEKDRFGPESANVKQTGPPTLSSIDSLDSVVVPVPNQGFFVFDSNQSSIHFLPCHQSSQAIAEMVEFVRAEGNGVGFDHLERAVGAIHSLKAMATLNAGGWRRVFAELIVARDVGKEYRAPINTLPIEVLRQIMDLLAASEEDQKVQAFIASLALQELEADIGVGILVRCADELKCLSDVKKPLGA